MDLIQLILFLIIPLLVTLFALFGTKEVKIELLLIMYIFAHQSSGPNFSSFSLSFEKVMSLILLFYMIFSDTNYFTKFKKLLPISIIFLLFFSWTSLVNGVTFGFFRIMFDLIQIIILPIFLFGFTKFSNISLDRFALALYRVGLLILSIQIFELFVNEDFYHYFELSEGFTNYIGSVKRNNTLRASSLFGQVSATAIFALIGLIITEKKTINIKSVIVFSTIIYFTGTRLGIGLGLIFLFLKLFPFIIPRNKTFYLIAMFSLFTIYQNLDILLNYTSFITRSGSDLSFQDTSKDSSLFQRDMQFDYAYEFIFTKKSFFGFGRQRAIDLIQAIESINTCDSRIILYLLYGGIPGLIIYLTLWSKLIWFSNFEKKHTYNYSVRLNLTLVLFLFMAFSSISDYFFLFTLTLSILYFKKYANTTSK